MNSNKKKIIFILSFVLLNIFSVVIVSVFQIYQRYVDLNASIVNGVNLAVKNGILFSDIRGSLRDITESYLSGNVMSSSHLINQINKVDIIRKDIDICRKNRIFLITSESEELTTYVTKKENNFYFCFHNKFYSSSKQGQIEIASWINSYLISYNTISLYLKHIILISGIILILSVFVLYKMFTKQEELRKKEITQDVISKVKHEIVRPVAKITSICEVLYNSDTTESIKNKLFQIITITRTHRLIVDSMFSYAIEMKNKKSLLNKNKIILNDLIRMCIDLSFKDNTKDCDFNINLSKIIENNYILMDEIFLAICFLNLLTNSYEAYHKNLMSNIYNLKKLKIEINAFYKEENLTIEIKNYGSYLPKENYVNIFDPGVTGNKETNTGYGLSIIKDIVQLYNGFIEVNSEKNNDINFSWVSFKINFKGIFISEIKNSINSNCIYDSNFKFSLNLLIVDDELFYINYFKKILKPYSILFDITYCCSIQESLFFINNKKYDLAIIDMKFGNDLNGGYRLLHELKDKTIKTIIHSSSFIKIKESFYKFDYVQKSISFLKMKEIISDVYKCKYNITNEVLQNTKLNVVVVDDEPHLYQEWEGINQEFNFIYFKHYDEFFDSIDSKILSVENIKLVLTDYYFDKVKIGLTLVSSDNLGSLREIYEYNGMIVLVSNISHVTHKYINTRIDKIPTNLISLFN